MALKSVRQGQSSNVAISGSIGDLERTGLIAQRSYIIVLGDVNMLLARVNLPGTLYAYVWCWWLFPGLEGREVA